MRKQITIIATQFRHSSYSSINAAAAPAIQRHGTGDGVLTLNVGGTKFQTLRSTVAQNAVLMDSVARAEANSEFAGGGAVFVDRDPKHFGMILSYLRNEADGVHGRAVSRGPTRFGGRKSDGPGANNGDRRSTPTIAVKLADSISTASLVQLPKDSKLLSEMYFESVHYDIPELTDRITCQQSLTRVFGLFGSKNPFQMAANAAAYGKRMLVVMGGMVTGIGGWMYTEATIAGGRTNALVAAGAEGRGHGDSAAVKGQWRGEDASPSNGGNFWQRRVAFWKAAAVRWSGNAGERWER